MTAEEKTALARMLDLAGDYLGGGYGQSRDYAFSDDPPDSGTEEAAGEGFSSLPLAYQVAEGVPEYEGEETLAGIAAAVRRCEGCALGQTRKNAVPGEGVENPLVLVVGEGPGADEDASGRPFVGPAGQYLDRMLAAVKLSREKNCFIANTVKCRPPGNRDPFPEESAACAAFLDAQIRLLRPKAILCVGRTAAQRMLDTSGGINSLRGRFFNPEKYGGIPLLPTFHPSAVLRNQSLRAPVWEDLKLLRARLEEMDSY